MIDNSGSGSGSGFDSGSGFRSGPGFVVPKSRYGSEVFKQGLELYKRQSLPLFLLAFGEVAFGYVVPLMLPLPLKAIVYFVTPVVSIGALRCIRYLDQNPEKATVSETFKYFYDDSRRMDYLPLCVISLLAALLTSFVGGGMFGVGGLAILLIEALVALTFFYGLPLVEFNRMPAKDALQLSLTATTRNWKSLTVYGLLFVAYFVLSCISLGVGLLFLVPIASATRFYFWQTSFDPGAGAAGVGGTGAGRAGGGAAADGGTTARAASADSTVSADSVGDDARDVTPKS